VANLWATWKETWEILARVSQALAVGGTVTPDEIRARRLLDEVREGMEALARLQQGLTQVLNDEAAD